MEDHFSSESNWPQINNFGNDTLLHPIWQNPPRLYSAIPNAQDITSSCYFPIQDKAGSASTSHSQAEKRRRDRINTQLGILRKLVPKSDKMDKAALLGSAIDQVKELKEKAKEASKGITVPTEVDEVTVDQIDTCNNSDKNNNTLIRASVCCEDQPEVLSELIRAVKRLRLDIVGADFASVGGRLLTILILCQDLNRSDFSLCAIKQSFHLALSRISSSSSPSNSRVRSKRQRFFLLPE